MSNTLDQIPVDKTWSPTECSRKLKPEVHSSWGGPALRILTLFQTTKCHFPHPFSDLAQAEIFGHHWADLATEPEGRLTTARANQTTGLTNGRATN